jgi:hypothetical protein
MSVTALQDTVLRIIDAVITYTDLLADLPPYLEDYGVDCVAAVGHSCELLAALAPACSNDRNADYFFDFGPEPLNREEALSSLHGFAQHLKALRSATSDYSTFPFMAVSVRCQTFSYHLLSSE